MARQKRTQDVKKMLPLIPSGGVSDHGALTGLGDDDHPQYLLATGKAADSDKLDGIDSTGFATASHIHDHGALTGLGDNDHPQYAMANHLMDGDGLNYSIATLIDSNQCFITILAANGTAPTSANFCTFRVGGTNFKLTVQKGFYIGAYDYFRWNQKGIAGNDAQLFVYAINNNGILCFGVAPSPNLTVVGSYRTADSIGSNPGFSNMVADVTSFAEGSECRVIGRVNVKQAVGNTWVAPTIAKVVSYPIFETDYLHQTSVTVGTYANITNCFISYRINRDNCLILGNVQNGSINTTSSVPITIRIIGPVKNLEPGRTPVMIQAFHSTDGWRVPFGATAIWGNFTVLEITKTILGGNWAINDTGIEMMFKAEYPINE